jgi:SAM-dependent methyltransferase
MSEENVERVRTDAAPIPPRELIERTGSTAQESDEAFISESYEQAGRTRKAGIVEALPDDWSFDGKRVLDFGCGSGRVLRQFLPEAASGEFWGCDLHAPTIEWLDQNLSPPLHFYVNDRIPTPHPDSHFDLVYAISVFTHITHEWSAWLLELHRILKPGGLLLATFLGPDAGGRRLSDLPGEDELGMCAKTVLGQSLDYSSGPLVWHSPWWLRSHWGRAFEILELRLGAFPFAGGRHGFVLGRKRDLSVSRDVLERPDPDDPREFEAQRRQFAMLEQEAAKMRAMLDRLRTRIAEVSEQRKRELATLSEVRATLSQVRARERAQRNLLRAMLGSRAFAVAEQLSRLRRRGGPVFSREQVRRVLDDADGSP